MQLDATLVERDWRWNCRRSFELKLGKGLLELFFIDTNPAVQKYYDRPWANFTGTGSTCHTSVQPVLLGPWQCVQSSQQSPISPISG